jgi:uncharacterized protein YyaL (SSP411 family)
MAQQNRTTQKYTNALIHEESPYLKEHAHNPIDWYPWGDIAFKKAEKEDKLIFLSIGYSTCHWCHVMERESFENLEIANFMNLHYVSIKVDREELPHIDRYYQDLYMLLNKRAGGWPLTVVMTPDRKPFFADTYLPPFNRYGRSGLLGMLQYLYETFRDKRENVYKSADSIVAAMQNVSRKKERDEAVDIDAKKLMEDFVSDVEAVYDKRHKGIGGAPKFPHATTLQMLIAIYKTGGEKKALDLATDALVAMAEGGIYDQIEGGFYRYSVDEKWMVPHFEKMLYTNAELIALYSDAYDVTKRSLFARIVKKTVENLDERFEKEGLYYSASDADSDGEEGKYFLFSYKEAKDALLKHGFNLSEAESVLAYLHIDKKGNFEGKTNPYLQTSDLDLPKRYAEAKRVLKQLRQKVAYPFIDYKIQTSWNALLASALFSAVKIDRVYGHKAVSIVDNLLEKLYIDDLLYHQRVLPHAPKVRAYLEDYAFLIDALIAAYQFTLEISYLKVAKKLTDEALHKFYRKGVWYMSDDDFDSEASLYDASYRSALAVMLENLLKLAILNEDMQMYERVSGMIVRFSSQVEHAPQNFPTFVSAYLGLKLGWTILKIPKKEIEESRSAINSIAYPFLLLKPYDGEHFLACKMDRCFANGEKIEDIVEKIK